MPIDTSMYSNIKPVQIESPLNALAQVAQVQNAQNQNRLAELTFGEKQRAIGQESSMNEQYKNALDPDGTLNRNKLFSGFANAGLGSKLPDLQKKFLDTDKAGADLKKTQGEISAQDFKLSEDKRRVATQNLAKLALDPDLTLEKVKASMEQGIADGYADAKTAMAKFQSLPQDPAQLRMQLQRDLLSILSPEQQHQAMAPKTEFKDTGGQIVAIQNNPNLPGYGQPIQGAALKKTQSPDSVASVSATLRGQDISASTARRGQDMTDSRTREFNDTKVEENKIKREAKDETANLTKSSQIASFDTMLGTLDRLGKHPGLSRSVGAIGALPTMPGSDSANFQAELNTFQSQAFLPMVAQLKGMGALSDAEGKKLTAAVGALDPKMGEKAFRESVSRITADMEAARGRMVGKSSGTKPSANSATTFDADKEARYQAWKKENGK